MYAWNGTDYLLVNNILAQCEASHGARDYVTDYLTLPASAIAEDGRYRLLLREDEQEVTRLDELTAIAVTSEPNSRVMVAPDGPRACRVTDELPPIRAVTPDGQQAGHLIEAEDDQTFTSLTAGYLDITYRLNPADGSLNLLGPTPPPKNMLKVADTGNAPPSKVTVSLLQDDGTFRTIHSLYPRRLTSAEPMDLGDLNPDDSLMTIRLEWTRQITLDYLPLIAAEPAPCTVTPVAMAKAEHSSRSILLSALTRDDGQTVTLEPGEQLELEFEAPTPPDGQQQTIVIKAVGRYDRRQVDHEADPSTIPGSYEFAQNYPNPFNPTTTFEFALPQSGRVSLEIYNLLGQKVATVIKRSYPVGRHTVAWDGATDRGTPIASGIYFARFTADAFTATKKLVVMK